jgi:hypothetical protein
MKERDAMTPEYIRRELSESIADLPLLIKTEEHGSVLRSWVSSLPHRLQGVLVTAIRGCDGAPKEDPSKQLSSLVRRAILNPADERESLNERGFFGFSVARTHKDLPEFLHSMDQYPLHFVSHLMHASQVIAYGHPEWAFRRFFALVYRVECSYCRAWIVPSAELALDCPQLCDACLPDEHLDDPLIARQLDCFKLHVSPETQEHMLERLTEDRIVKGTTAREGR